MKAFLLVISVLFVINCMSQDVLKTCQVKLSKCSLLDKPYGIAIANIKKGENVDVIDVVNGYYEVVYKGNTGYIVDIFINDSELIDIIKQKRIEKENADFEAEQARIEKQNKIADSISEIANKKLWDEAEARQKRKDDEYNAKIKYYKEESVRIENENKKHIAQAKLNEENRKKRLIEKYGTEKAKIIISGNVYIGMTASEARDSWGSPNDINRTITKNYTHEQWVYSQNRYLYFENGILTTIQD